MRLDAVRQVQQARARSSGENHPDKVHPTSMPDGALRREVTTDGWLVAPNNAELGRRGCGPISCENAAVTSLFASSMPLPALARTGTRVMADDFTDPQNARLVWIASGGLALVGVALLVGTVLWWRSSRVEHPALGPLEVMSARSFFKAADGEQRRMLDEVRPDGAKPVGAQRPDPVDLSAAAAQSHAVGFDDLREVAPALDAADDPETQYPSLAEITKGINKPAEPRIAAIEALLDDHPINGGDAPIDPLLQRVEPSDR